MSRIAIAVGLSSALLFLGDAHASEPSEPAPAEAKAAKEAVEKSLPLLRKGAEGHVAKKSCFACHNQALPMLAIRTAQQRGFTIPDLDLTRQTKFIAEFLDKNQENYKQGKGQGGQVDTAGYALFTLELGDWKPDATTDAVVEYLLLRDKNADHWRSGGNRPPTEASSFTTSYLAIRALKKWGADAQQERIDKRLEAVRGWLRKTAAKDTEDRVFRLFALAAVGEPAKKRQAAIEELKESQREDGGWAQLASLESDAYATGTALVALHQAGDLATSDPAYQRGIAFLLKCQQADGSWHVRTRSKPFQTYFETGFPHGKDQFISSAASGWAATALALSFKPPEKRPAVSP
jgi:Squalene-hopene cyclase C-terminal domain